MVNDKWFDIQDDKKSDDEEESADLTLVQLLKEDKKNAGIPPISPLEVHDYKWLQILTLNKLLTRLPVLLAQTKTGNNP